MYYFCQKLIDLLKAELEPDTVKYFVLGRPEIAPKEVINQNAIYVFPQGEAITVGDSANDRKEVEIVIRTMVNIQQFWQENDYVFLPQKKAADIVQGRDEDGFLKGKTVEAIVRKNISRFGWKNQGEPTVTYDVQGDLEQYKSAVDLTLFLEIYDERKNS